MKDPFHNQQDNKIYVWAFLLVLLPALFISWLVFSGNSHTVDEGVFENVSPYTTPERTQLMLLVSFLGKHSFLIPANVLLLLLFIFTKNRKAAITVAIVSLSSVTVMSLLKRTFQRHRPAGPLVDGITNFSFPSGHAFMSVAFYGLLIWWASVSIQNKWLRWSFTALLCLIILTIGFSRIYLRVHYTTDVLAGFFFGAAWLMISFFLADKLERSRVK